MGIGRIEADRLLVDTHRCRCMWPMRMSRLNLAYECTRNKHQALIHTAVRLDLLTHALACSTAALSPHLACLLIAPFRPSYSLPSNGRAPILRRITVPPRVQIPPRKAICPVPGPCARLQRQARQLSVRQPTLARAPHEAAKA